MKVTKEQIDALMERVRDWGCHCDLRYGMSCGHSQIINDIRNLFIRAGIDN